MELIYPWVLYIGTPLIFCLAFFFYKRSKHYRDGRKVVNAEYLAETPYFKKLRRRYKVLKFSALFGLIVSMIATMVLLTRPVKVETINEEAHNRDIFLCMDISDSMDAVNLKVVKQLQELVTELQGERFGITIFNGQSVLLVPLTTDYDYVMETLKKLQEVFEYSNSINSILNFDYEMYYYKYEGTLCDRGSSFIGEGLASCLYSFTDLDEDPDRTRMIVFTTDNELNGEPLVTLEDAAKLCAKHKVKVFSLTPNRIVEQDIFEPAINGTGGGFYTTNNSKALDEMLTAIRKTGTNVTENIRTVVTDHRPMLIFCTILLDIAFVVLVFIPYFIIRRRSILHHLLQGVALLMVAALNIRLAKPPEEVMDYTGKTDVLFVIDNTISMMAEDYQGNLTRMSGVREDVQYIMDQFAGARFSVITFANEAHRMVPYTNDQSVVKQALLSLGGMTKYTAKGTGLNAPISQMKDVLQAGYQKGNRQIVFFISDGEITDDSMVNNYGVLAEFVDGGAVLGYGTAEGGRMQVYPFSGADTKEYLQYYDKQSYEYKDALSVIDEKNLEYIAKCMKVPYIHMGKQADIYPTLLGLITDDLLTNRGGNEEEGASLPDLVFFLMIPLFPLFGYDYIYIKRKL